MGTCIRHAARVALGLAVAAAGVTHFTVGRREFQKLVPESVPFDKDAVVLASGAVEIGLGAALVLAPKHRRFWGAVTAWFFVVVFAGNFSQWMHRRNAFGLDTDMKRFVRLLIQPILIAWAVWSTRTPR